MNNLDILLLNLQNAAKIRSKAPFSLNFLSEFMNNMTKWAILEMKCTILW